MYGDGWRREEGKGRGGWALCTGARVCTSVCVAHSLFVAFEVGDGRVETGGSELGGLREA